LIRPEVRADKTVRKTDATSALAQGERLFAMAARKMAASIGVFLHTANPSRGLASSALTILAYGMKAMLTGPIAQIA
jgi:hypothetical protein